MVILQFNFCLVLDKEFFNNKNVHFHLNDWLVLSPCREAREKTIWGDKMGKISH